MTRGGLQASLPSKLLIHRLKPRPARLGASFRVSRSPHQAGHDESCIETHGPIAFVLKGPLQQHSLTSFRLA